jgi:hypothetical protein
MIFYTFSVSVMQDLFPFSRMGLFNPLEPKRTLNYVVVHFGFIYISCCKSYPCHPIFDFFLLLN